MKRVSLETFLSLARLKHFGWTAQYRNITRSTVSTRISGLVSDLNVTLFDRTAGRATPTGQGQDSLGHAAEVLDRMSPVTGADPYREGTLWLALWKPEIAGRSISYFWRDRLASSLGVVLRIIIFVLVVGSIYGGWATPTEAAAICVAGATGIAATRRRLSISMLMEAAKGTVIPTSMIMLIIIATCFLNMILAGTGLTDALNGFVTELGLSKMQMPLAMVCFYILLGCFMETLSMMITTIPIIAPLMFSLGFDPIWYGILMMILIEAALITPPDGLNLYIVQGLRGGGPIKDVMIRAMPFVLAMAVMIILLTLYPGLATGLPGILES